MAKKKSEPIKITVIKTCSVAGRVVEAGKTWTAEEEEALALINANKAKRVEDVTQEDKDFIEEQHRKHKAKQIAKGEIPDDSKGKKAGGGSGGNSGGSSGGATNKENGGGSK